jgi:hypothetical protein
MPNKIHKNCGGAIKNGKCTKCGKEWGIIKRAVAEDIVDPLPDKFDPDAYRRRIRNCKDLK